MRINRIASMVLIGCAALPLTATESKEKIMEKKTNGVTQTAGRKALGEFAPDFAKYNDDILFGEVWNDATLDVKTRSMLTVAALQAMGVGGVPIQHHLANAKKNGVAKDEIAALITHVGFYAGWPKAWGVFTEAQKVWEGEIPVQTRDEFQASTPYPIGEFNKDYAQYFIGNSYLAPMDSANGGPINVTFEPGCRNNWHVHHKGVQVIVCVAGRGWYQEEGKEPVELVPGKTIAIPAEVKHWHGAAKDSWMQHLTYMTKTEDGASNEWLEPVTDEVYGKLP